MAQFFFPALPLNSGMGTGLKQNFLAVSLCSLTREAQYMTNCNRERKKKKNSNAYLTHFRCMETKILVSGSVFFNISVQFLYITIEIVIV